MSENKTNVMPERSDDTQAILVAEKESQAIDNVECAEDKENPDPENKPSEANAKPPGKKRSIPSVIGSVISGTITVALLLIIAVLIFALFNKNPDDNGVNIGSYRLLTVASGSMRPTFNEGDAIIIKSVPPEDLKIGDIITYQPPGTAYRTQVTHRIVDIVDGTERFDEPLAFVTRGDFNKTDDAQPRPASKIIGKYVFHIPKLGIFLDYAATTRGLIVIGAVFVAYCFLEVLLKEFINKLLKKRRGLPLKENSELPAAPEEKPEPKLSREPKPPSQNTQKNGNRKKK